MAEVLVERLLTDEYLVASGTDDLISFDADLRRYVEFLGFSAVSP